MTHDHRVTDVVLYTVATESSQSQFPPMTLLSLPPHPPIQQSLDVTMTHDRYGRATLYTVTTENSNSQCPPMTLLRDLKNGQEENTELPDQIRSCS